MIDPKALFSLLRARFEEHSTDLNALDSEVGDGDHGFTISRAFAAAELAVLPIESTDLGAYFDAAAGTLATSAGGAIGPLLAALFAEGGVAFAGKSAIDTPNLAAFFQGGLEAVQEVGEAQPGEKTLIDALVPAANALQQNCSLPLPEALEETSAAAWQGAQATQGMVGVHGRAHFLGERSKGYQDAGATSIAIMVDAFRDVARGKSVLPREALKMEPVPPPPGKAINHPDDMIREEVEGLALAHPHYLQLAAETILVRSGPKENGKVALVIGHGGGHTPSMAGFVGHGLLDADAYGPVFTCAPGVQIAEAISLANRNAGVVLLISNHAGDVLNARLALRRAQQEGINAVPVLLTDDIATAPREQFLERRGLGGLLFALKIGGAAAEQGCDLAEVVRLMEKANEYTATLMVTLRSGTHPASGKLMSELPVGQIEVGAGVHGEAGVYRGEHLSADDLADMMLDRLVADLDGLHDGRVLTFLNGAGGTSMMELHILQRRVHHYLAERDIEVAASVVGSFFTTQEMGGFSLSVGAVDDEILNLWHEPAAGPFFKWP